MSFETGERTDEKKPMPVACEKCGAATDHDLKMCSYCVRKIVSRLPPLVADPVAPEQQSRAEWIASSQIEMLATDAAGVVMAWATSRNSIVAREPWRRSRRGR